MRKRLLGFRLMINPVAARLGVPLTNVYANQILFDAAVRVSSILLFVRPPLLVLSSVPG